MRHAHRWITTIICLVFVGMRVPWHASEQNDYRLMNDSLYQLQRVMDTRTTWPKVHGTDPMLHYPHGYQLHWPSIYPLFLTTLTLPFEAQNVHDLAPRLAWLPIAIGLIAMMLWMSFVGCLTTSRTYSLATGLFISISPYAISLSRYAEMDHHLYVDLALAMMVWGYTYKKSFVPWAGLAVGLSFTPEFSFYAIILVGIWSWYHGHEPSKHMMIPGIVAFAVWFIDQGMEIGPIHWWSIYRLSLFQVSVFAAIALAALITRFVKSADILVPSLIWFAALLAGITAILLSVSGGFDLLLDRLGHTGRLAISEESPMLRWPLWHNQPIVLLTFLIAVIQVIQVIKYLSRGEKRRFAVNGLILLTLMVSLREVRHFGALQSACIAASVLVVWSLPARRVAGLNTHGIAAFFGLVFFAISLIGFRKALNRENALWAPRVDEVVYTASQYTQRDDGIMASWSLGHQIRVLAHRSVVVDPFNFPEPIDQQLIDVFLAPDAAHLHQGLTDNSATVFMATNPISVMASVMEDDDPRWVAWFAPGVQQPIAVRPEIQASPAFTAWFGAGEIPIPGLMPFSVSRSFESVELFTPQGVIERKVPVCTGFRMVPGARILSAPEDDLVLITKQGKQVPIAKSETTHEALWHVSIPAPSEFGQTYRLLRGDTEVDLQINTDQIKFGQELDLRKASSL
ncbi:MAG: hypothetical protein KDC35_02420 [Acidobacteria bacterium]|nr:hypothetical protein [Acidobacteriota bacterium]